MKNDNKKIILHLVTLAAISFSIVSLFAPVLTFNLMDIYQDMGYEDSDQYWKADIYFLFQEYVRYDYGNIFKKSNVAHIYYFLYFFRYSTANWAKEELTPYQLGENQEQIPSSRILGNMIEFIFGGLLFILFFYFLYKTIKNCGNKKTKYFLYAGVTALAVVIGFVVSTYYIFNVIDVNKLNYINYLKFGFGFYYLLASAVLFFIAHFIQFFIDFTNNTNEKAD